MRLRVLSHCRIKLAKCEEGFVRTHVSRPPERVASDTACWGICVALVNRRGTSLRIRTVVLHDFS